MFPKVYVSYTENTKSYAETFVGHLTDTGYSVWAGFKDLRPGQRWRDFLEHAVKDARIFIVFVGPHSRTNSFLDTEWQAIVEATWNDPESVVMPVLIKDAAPAAFLRAWVPLRIDPDSQTDWIERVMTAIKECRSKSALAMRQAILERLELERQQRLDENQRAVRAMQEQESQRIA